MNESQVFTNALKLATAAERAAYLDEACAGNPQLRAEAGLPPTPPPAEEKPTEPPVKEEKTPPTNFGADSKPPEPAGPVDPFDPIIFNRQMHPEKK